MSKDNKPISSQSRNQQFSDRLDYERKKRIEIEKSNEELQHEVNHLRNRLKDFQHIVQTLQNENENDQAQIFRETDDVKKKIIYEYEHKLSVFRNQNDEFKVENFELQKKLNEKEAEIKTLSDRKKELEGRCFLSTTDNFEKSVIGPDLEKAYLEIKDLHSKYMEVLTSNREYERVNETLTSEKQQLELDIAALHDTIAEYREMLEEYQEAEQRRYNESQNGNLGIDGATNLFSEVHDAKVRIEKRYRALKKRLAEMQENNDELELLNTRLAHDNSKLQNESFKGTYGTTSHFPTLSANKLNEYTLEITHLQHRINFLNSKVEKAELNATLPPECLDLYLAMLQKKYANKINFELSKKLSDFRIGFDKFEKAYLTQAYDYDIMKRQLIDLIKYVRELEVQIIRQNNEILNHIREKFHYRSASATSEVKYYQSRRCRQRLEWELEEAQRDNYYMRTGSHAKKWPPEDEDFENSLTLLNESNYLRNEQLTTPGTTKSAPNSNTNITERINQSESDTIIAVSNIAASKSLSNETMSKEENTSRVRFAPINN